MQSWRSIRYWLAEQTDDQAEFRSLAEQPLPVPDKVREQLTSILLDLGDIHALPARSALRLTDIFVSHTHIDHFAGFDRLLRLFVGRPKLLRLYGPPGFIGNVEAKLAAS